MTINGLNNSPFYTTSSPEDYATAAGSWFGASANRTNMTIGDFERSDRPPGICRGVDFRDRRLRRHALAARAAPERVAANRQLADEQKYGDAARQ